MIGYLAGDVIYVSHGVITVGVAGVGYDVSVPSSLMHLSSGDAIELFVHTHVREDAITLFGFTSVEEREMFRLLLSTPGVGPSTALGALSTLSVAALTAAIFGEDVDTIATIPGIGKKTASRLVLELAGRLPETRTSANVAVSSVRSSVESALKSLGYGAVEIRETLDATALPEDESEALRVALRQLSMR